MMAYRGWVIAQYHTTIQTNIGKRGNLKSSAQTKSIKTQLIRDWETMDEISYKNLTIKIENFK